MKKEEYMEKSDYSSLTRQSMHATKREWNLFLSIFLLATGVALTIAGIVFFFAYNWDEIPNFAKLGMIEILLVVSVLLTVFTRWNLLTKQILLTAATFLTGTLFAVFGQIYQTGADAYDLFLGWTLFTILWAVAIRFAPLWLTFLGLVCITLWLYVVQIVPDKPWESALLTNAVTWICASATVITERMSIKGTMDKHNRWFVSLLSLATIVHASYLMMAVICERTSILSVPLITTLILFPAGLWFGWKQKNLYYLAAIPFAVLMILLTVFMRFSAISGANLFLCAGIIVISGTTLLIYVVLHLKKQWYGTEE